MSKPDDLGLASVGSLRGVGPALLDKLSRVGILSLRDLLFHLPLRYEDRTRLNPIGQAQPGQSVVLEGRVIACDISFGKRRSLLAYLQDGTGTIALRFFHFSKQQQASLKNATTLRCYGEVRRGAAGLEIYHPEYTPDTKTPLEQHLTTVYPVTEGLGQSRIRAIVTQVLAMMDAGKLLTDIPMGSSGFLRMDINQALRLLHCPTPNMAMD